MPSFPSSSLVDPNPAWAQAAIARLQDVMTEDLLKPEWRGGATRTAGHCYAASEALFHALGRQGAGWKSMTMRFGPGTHWFLKHESGVVLDPTWDQFGVPVPYDQARGAGFLTVKPSKRAQTLLARAGMAIDGLVGLMPAPAGDEALKTTARIGTLGWTGTLDDDPPAPSQQRARRP